jgi:hypothetical protein
MVGETLHVDCAELLHQYPRRISGDLDFRTERCRRRTARRRSDDGSREPKQPIRSDDYAVAGPPLFVTATSRQANAVDVAACHAGQSAATASMSAMTD